MTNLTPQIPLATTVPFASSWSFSTDITATDPGVQTLKFNNAVLANVTELFVSSTTRESNVIDVMLAFLSLGMRVYAQQTGDPTKAVLLQLSGPGVDNTGWWTFPVTVISSNVLMDEMQQTSLMFDMTGAGVSVSGTPTAESIAYFVGPNTLAGDINLYIADEGGGRSSLNVSGDYFGADGLFEAFGGVGDYLSFDFDDVNIFSGNDAEFEADSEVFITAGTAITMTGVSITFNGGPLAVGKVGVINSVLTFFAAAANQVVFCDDDTAGGAQTVTLPAGAAGAQITIKKLGTTGTVTIVSLLVGQLIDGQITFDLTAQYSSLTVFWNGSEWSII